MARAARSIASYPTATAFRIERNEEPSRSPTARTAGMTATAGCEVPHRCPSSSSMECAMIPVAIAAFIAGTFVPSQRITASGFPPMSRA